MRRRPARRPPGAGRRAGGRREAPSRSGRRRPGPSREHPVRRRPCDSKPGRRWQRPPSRRSDASQPDPAPFAGQGASGKERRLPGLTQERAPARRAVAGKDAAEYGIQIGALHASKVRGKLFASPVIGSRIRPVPVSRLPPRKRTTVGAAASHCGGRQLGRAEGLTAPDPPGSAARRSTRPRARPPAAIAAQKSHSPGGGGGNGREGRGRQPAPRPHASGRDAAERQGRGRNAARGPLPRLDNRLQTASSDRQLPTTPHNSTASPLPLRIPQPQRQPGRNR